MYVYPWARFNLVGMYFYNVLLMMETRANVHTFYLHKIESSLKATCDRYSAEGLHAQRYSCEV